jgi:hypothetical protein
MFHASKQCVLTDSGAAVEPLIIWRFVAFRFRPDYIVSTLVWSRAGNKAWPQGRGEVTTANAIYA